ncbi:probable leucine-rich repeat receptor-like protein kinase At1g35710 [Capsicum annuum]|uniref:probable leucine-rich repeat receptor-like protein kinase At1g35710 n=1 Tax=Capsicum annuum TaxID=4072 RepID=UPI001FB0FE8F|nr:probable leucine-rich repeat receptor-like protein kinase At1g35710 [Capsicum annuum]
MEYNQITGSVPISLLNISSLQILSLSMNNLSGFLPREIGNLTKMQHLWISGNKLIGEIPKEISNLVELELLDLGNLTNLSLSLNTLNGILPASTGNLSTSLIRFYANNCKIKGRIPNEVGNLSSLLDLDLSGNNLHLGDIYLDQNQLSGSLPNCLGNITSLREIHLGSNKLSSNIPPSLGNLQDLVVLNLSSNNMVGSLPPEIENLKAATLIDLSMNQFSNGIPTEIGGLQNLANLSLRHNKLQGAIPDSMSNMVGLEFLDLSHNNISGIIPKSLEKLQNLKYFNVFVNKLYVEIPSGVLSRISRVSFSSTMKHFVFVTMAFVLLWIRYRRGKSAPQQAESLSTVTRERISYDELLQATDDLSESNLIGFGSFGSVYKGVLRSGTAIAVKVFNLQLDAAFKIFDTECDVLCSLRHRNLVKVNY